MLLPVLQWIPMHIPGPLHRLEQENVSGIRRRLIAMTGDESCFIGIFWNVVDPFYERIYRRNVG
jgi:hypothetical protein